jgi:hypothetical protein
MPSKRQQKAKSVDVSFTKTSEKEELLQARAVKRAERVEARRIHAEKHKEDVCTHYHPCHPLRATRCRRVTQNLTTVF